MAFSDSMRECLGGSGVRVELTLDPPRATRTGRCTGAVQIVGGTDEVFVRGVVLRLLAATRHWVDGDGRRIEEHTAASMPSRRHLTPAWTRTSVSEARVDVNERVAAGASISVDAQVPVPDECPVSGPGTVLTINAQAVIEGQIDPTGSAPVTIM